MKNPFEKFQKPAALRRETSSQTKNPANVSRPSAAVKNPFEEFRHISDRPDRQIPLDEILASHESVLARLEGGYKRLVADEAGEGPWQPDKDSIVEIYTCAESIVGGIPCETGDIEAFCVHATQSDDPDYFMMGPLGLYLSALCNTSHSPEVHLNLAGPELRVPLLGYRLQEGHTLIIEGDLGDLIGISLNGGHLKINGNVGRYLGAGMVAGRIDVSGDAGRFIGEQMTGGDIHIRGRIGGSGKPQGGAIYHRKRQIYPPPKEKN